MQTKTLKVDTRYADFHPVKKDDDLSFDLYQDDRDLYPRVSIGLDDHYLGALPSSNLEYLIATEKVCVSSITSTDDRLKPEDPLLVSIEYQERA